MVNCGAAMYMSPVGVVNAADPVGAYKEAIEIAGAHQSSFGREAAGVFAACVAQSFVSGTTVKDIVECSIDLANDGTKRAIEAVVKAAEGVSDWKAAIPVLRQAFKPFDTLEDEYRVHGDDARKPSRLLAIEELPIAIGMFAVAGGDFRKSVLGGVNYGRDSDSIATMAGSIAGGLNGIENIPSDWLSDIEKASRRDFSQSADKLSNIARAIGKKDADKARATLSAREILFSNKGN
jgi:ADP-ribosylglycohydrolase